jgi:hypothetical protein
MVHIARPEGALSLGSARHASWIVVCGKRLLLRCVDFSEGLRWGLIGTGPVYTVQVRRKGQLLRMTAHLVHVQVVSDQIRLWHAETKRVRDTPAVLYGTFESEARPPDVSEYAVYSALRHTCTDAPLQCGILTFVTPVAPANTTLCGSLQRQAAPMSFRAQHVGWKGCAMLPPRDVSNVLPNISLFAKAQREPRVPAVLPAGDLRESCGVRGGSRVAALAKERRNPPVRPSPQSQLQDSGGRCARPDACSVKFHVQGVRLEVYALPRRQGVEVSFSSRLFSSQNSGSSGSSDD